MSNDSYDYLRHMLTTMSFLILSRWLFIRGEDITVVECDDDASLVSSSNSSPPSFPASLKSTFIQESLLIKLCIPIVAQTMWTCVWKLNLHILQNLEPNLPYPLNLGSHGLIFSRDRLKHANNTLWKSLLIVSPEC